MIRCNGTVAFLFLLVLAYSAAQVMGVVSRAHTSNYHGLTRRVMEYVRSKRRDGPFTVVDVGGSANLWSAPLLEDGAVVDFMRPDQSAANPKAMPASAVFFKADFGTNEGWGAVLDRVAKVGKFNFSICSNTLEDIPMDPAVLLRRLAQISHEGVVSVPSHHLELSRQADTWMCFGRDLSVRPSRGFFHHRWIFYMKLGKLRGLPKLPLVEADEALDQALKGNLISSGHLMKCGAWARNPAALLNVWWSGELQAQVVSIVNSSSWGAVSLYRQGLLKNDVNAMLQDKERCWGLDVAAAERCCGPQERLKMYSCWEDNWTFERCC
eukprot:gb/GFBE01035639.1/.p1 GENE.gb/GFBE01035639.1/~~gb/GFBE01035639.1/.p1  ORF type:complete len:324 (+),score=53.05 gb/GFBE01035639.1/:2-973(+)